MGHLGSINGHLQDVARTILDTIPAQLALSAMKATFGFRQCFSFTESFVAFFEGHCGRRNRQPDCRSAIVSLVEVEVHHFPELHDMLFRRSRTGSHTGPPVATNANMDALAGRQPE